MADTSIALVKPVVILPQGLYRALTPIHPGAAAPLPYPVAAGAKVKAWMVLHIGTAGLSRLVLKGPAGRFAASFQEVAGAITSSETRLRQLYGRWYECNNRIAAIVGVRPTVVWNERRGAQLADVSTRIEALDEVFAQLWGHCQEARFLVKGAHLVNLAPLAEAQERLSLGAFLSTRGTAAACTIEWLGQEISSCEHHLTDMESFLALQRGALEDILPWGLHHELALRCHTLELAPALLGDRLDPADQALQTLQHTNPEVLLGRVIDARRHLEGCHALLDDIAQARFLLDQSGTRIEAYAGHPGFTPLLAEVTETRGAFQALLEGGCINTPQLTMALKRAIATLALFNTACESHVGLQQRLHNLVKLQVPPALLRWQEVVRGVEKLVPQYNPDCPEIQELNAAMLMTRTVYEQLQAALAHAERHLGQRDWMMASQYLDTADKAFRRWSDTIPYELLRRLTMWKDLVDRVLAMYRNFRNRGDSSDRAISAFVRTRHFYRQADQMRRHAEAGRYDLAVKLARWVDAYLVDVSIPSDD